MTLPLVLSLVLAVLAAAHAWWAMGRIWPAASEPELARAVIGDGRSRMPPPWQCAAVAIVLAGRRGLAVGGGRPGRKASSC